jgi:hypothetical protein
MQDRLISVSATADVAATKSPRPAKHSRDSEHSGSRSEHDSSGDRDAPPSEALVLSIENEMRRLRTEATDRLKAAQSLRSVAKADLVRRPDKLAQALGKVESALPPETRARLGLETLLRGLRDYVVSAPERHRRELGRSLKQACDAEGLELRVVSRESPIEVRIPPLSVVLDFPKGKADLRFAREAIASCQIDARAIISSYMKVVRSLNSGFSAETFFDSCRSAYQRVLRVDGLPDGHRVELGRFLPELALMLQPKRWLEDPVEQNYRSYSRARFAYDVYRLRQANALQRNGARINFGVATGVSASSKRRVIYMEDALGSGEYKLTIFFTPSDSIRPTND